MSMPRLVRRIFTRRPVPSITAVTIKGATMIAGMIVHIGVIMTTITADGVAVTGMVMTDMAAGNIVDGRVQMSPRS